MDVLPADTAGAAARQGTAAPEGPGGVHHRATVMISEIAKNTRNGKDYAEHFPDACNCCMKPQMVQVAVQEGHIP